jgi:polar amino acid transport system permease protein
MKQSRASDRSHFLPIVDRLKRLPYWLLTLILLALAFGWYIASHQEYRVILDATARGLLVTMGVSVVAFGFSLLAGLGLGLMRTSHFRVLREMATFYIEVVRGVPMLVILYYIAFVGAPGLVDFLNWLASPFWHDGIPGPFSVRNLDFTSRAVLALCIGYSAFIAEIIRAGIESIPRGQFEAALSLGMSRWQAMKTVVLPQAIRNVLPPLGNDFVAMVKDSALVSALGVQDVTQLGKVYSAGSFKFFETYNLVAFLYLILTVSLSLLIRLLEKRLNRDRRETRTLR